MVRVTQAEIKSVTRKHLQRKRAARGYQSDSDEEADGYIKLSHKNALDSSLQDSLKTWTAREADDDDEMLTANRARDDWGRDAAAYYDTELPSDSDDQIEALELQLEEAKQIRRARLAALTKEDMDQALMEYMPDGTAGPQKPVLGAVEEFVTLDVLLSGLVGGLGSSKKPSEVKPDIDDAVINLAAQFLVWKERCQEESCRYLLPGASDRIILSDGVRTYLEMQLTATIWLGLIIHSVGAYGTGKVEIFTHAKCVARVLGKLEKFRLKLGGDRMFNLLRDELLKFAAAPAAKPTADSAPTSSGEDYDDDDDLLDDSDGEGSSVDEEGSEGGGSDDQRSEAPPEAPKLSRLEAAIKAAEESEKLEATAREAAREKELTRLREALGAKPKKKQPKPSQSQNDVEEETVEGSTSAAIVPDAVAAAPADAKPQRKLSTKKRKELEEAKKELRRQEIIEQLPSLPSERGEEEGRSMPWEIAKNRGLIRKRKREEKHSRVHLRAKYAKRMRQAGSSTLKSGPAEAAGYSGESTGIAMHVVRGRKLA